MSIVDRGVPPHKPIVAPATTPRKSQRSPQIIAPLPPADFLILAQSAALCAAGGAYVQATPGHGEWRYVGELSTQLAANLAGLAALAKSTAPGVAE